MNFHRIDKDNMLNGVGLRTILWVSGCDHHCPFCQNPETHDECSGQPFTEEDKQEIFESLKPSWIDGITFSGGDPLYPKNRETVGNLIREIKELYPEKTVWLYTGFTFEEVKDLDFISLIDVMVDGEFKNDLKDIKLHWKGSSNQRVIDVKKSLESGEVVLYE